MFAGYSPVTKSILDELYSRILDEGRGFCEKEILRDFFKIEAASEDVASRILRPLLKGDSRFRQARDRTWSAVKMVSLDELPISETTFVLFAMDDPDEGLAASPQAVRDKASLLAARSAFLVYRNGVVLPDIDVLQVLKEANRHVFLPHDPKSLALLKRASRAVTPLAPDLKTLSIKTLIALLFPEKRLKTWDDIVREFSIVNLQSDTPHARVLTLKYIFEFLVAALQSRGLATLKELFEFQERAQKKVDFSRYGFDRDFLRDIPEMPGIYLFRDKTDGVIYVGKAGNLKVRINSYFWNTGESVDKIEGILERLRRIDYRVLGSDLEAMIEEYRLIDEHKPAFNTKLRVPDRALEAPDRILILPSAMQGMLKLYILSNTLPLRELDFDCAACEDEPLLELLKTIQTSKETVFDPAKVIALLYLKRYDENLNSIDIGRYGSPEEVVRALRHHCGDPGALFREKTTYLET
jgi:hypothetical protein